MIDYLTIADVLAMHIELVKRFGGKPGVRDAGALEAALYRPQSGYYQDIIAQAAALMESLAIGHPFMDGNKRIAFAATDIFLRINGYRIKDSPMKIHTWMMRLFEEQHFRLDQIEIYLRKKVIKE